MIVFCSDLQHIIIDIPNNIARCLVYILMIKYLIVCVFAMVLLTDDWHQYRSLDGMMEFHSPVLMRGDNDVALTSIGDINLNIYKSIEKDSFDTKYSVTYYELPIYINMESDSMFRDMTESNIESMLELNGALLDYSEVESVKDGYKRTFRISYHDNFVSKSVIQTNGTHILNAQCFVPIDRSLNSNIELFFERVVLYNLAHNLESKAR